MLSPLDEYPIHQTWLPVAEPGSSDRNFYDRCYFNAHDRTGNVFAITGFGVYPNLGVKDAYLTVGQGSNYRTVRFSDALDQDRMNQQVGSYRLEVIEPLSKIRVIAEASDGTLACDMTWDGSFPVLREQPHIMEKGHKVILNACRFAQVGSWEGTLSVDGTEYSVSPDTWMGTRDRSWGIRPVGGPETPGRGDGEMDPSWGMWWMYSPLRFDDFALVVIIQEDGQGYRILNDASIVPASSTGRGPQQIGWPIVDIEYLPGTRMAKGAHLRGSDADGGSITVDIECLGHVALNCGSGYGPDPEWTHGQWRGRNWELISSVDTATPEAAGRIPFATVDHVAKATATMPDGSVHEGWGMFEHMSIGAHPRSGFADLFSVSPADENTPNRTDG